MNRLWQICFADTRAGFDQIKDTTPTLFPALFVLVCLSLEFLLLEFLLSGFPGEEFSVIDSDSTENWFLQMPRLMKVVTLVSCIVGFVCIWWLLTSSFYFGAARLFNINFPWLHWLSLSCWSSIPLIAVPIFVVIAMIVQILPTPESDPWYIELTSACLVVLPFIWCVRISALGLRSWTESAGRGHVYWRVVAFVPYVLLLITFIFFFSVLMGLM